MRVVNLLSWRYRDPGLALAQRIRADKAVTRYSGIGGNVPQTLVNLACLDIAAGRAEVVLIVPLPELATAMDVDVTFQAYDPLMTDIVAVMFPPEAGFQGLGDAAAQVVTNLDERGLGLVTYPEGLNTGHKVAVSEDVPAGQIFRDLDGDGQAGDVMRRFLDNVAFRARNDEGVIAVARVRPESIQALLEWSLGNRAQSVNFAPVSAVLLDE